MDKSTMKKLIIAAVLCLFAFPAWAQCNGIFPAGTVCGTVAGGPPTAVLPSGFPTVGTSAGGVNSQVQYNNHSAFGGISGATTDGTTLTLSAPIITGFIAKLPLIGGGAGAVGQGTVSGNTSEFASVIGPLINGDCLSNNSGNVIDAGGPCTTSGGGGTVTAGIAGQLAIYASTGTVVSGQNPITIPLSWSGSQTYNSQAFNVPTAVNAGGSGSAAVNNCIVNQAANSLCLFSIVGNQGVMLFFGDNAGPTNLAGFSGLDEIGIGKRTLNALTSGDRDIGIGSDTLSSLTTGAGVICIGHVDCINTTTASVMTVIGNGSCDNCNSNGIIAIGPAAFTAGGGPGDIIIDGTGGASNEHSANGGNIFIGGNSAINMIGGYDNYCFGPTNCYPIVNGHDNIWFGSYTTSGDHSDSVMIADHFGTPFIDYNVTNIGGWNFPSGVPLYSGANKGLSCSGTPTTSFASVNGLVTHC